MFFVPENNIRMVMNLPATTTLKTCRHHKQELSGIQKKLSGGQPKKKTKTGSTENKIYKLASIISLPLSEKEHVKALYQIVDAD